MWLVFRSGLLTQEQKNLVLVARNTGIHWADATVHIPHRDASVDVLYCSHMVEHLDRGGAMSFLIEARRVLVPDGVIRIVVPDLKKLVAEYLEHDDADAFVERTLLTRPKPRNTAEKLKYLLIGERHHQWMYDEKSMVRLLTKAGFRSPQVLLPGATLIRDPGSLDLWERKEESVYVEARK